MARLIVKVTALVPGHADLLETTDVEVPPDYDQRDIDAFAVRNIEDTAFGLTLREFGRAPTRAALIAYVARLRAIEVAAAELDDLSALRDRIREVIETDNVTITEQWGEDPEGA